MQLEVVWNLLLQAGSEGVCPHLLCSYANFMKKFDSGALAGLYNFIQQASRKRKEF